MEANIKTMLDTEIQGEFSELANIEVGTEPYKIAVNGVTQLLDRQIELKKIEIERDEKAEALEMEMRLKSQQMRDDRADRIVKHVMSLITIGASIGLTVWGTRTAIKFEETGTISTTVGRLFFNKIVPKN